MNSWFLIGIGSILFIGTVLFIYKRYFTVSGDVDESVRLIETSEFEEGKTVILCSECESVNEPYRFCRNCTYYLNMGTEGVAINDSSTVSPSLFHKD